jgi:hypothetical protein
VNTLTPVLNEILECPFKVSSDLSKLMGEIISWVMSSLMVWSIEEDARSTLLFSLKLAILLTINTHKHSINKKI